MEEKEFKYVSKDEPKIGQQRILSAIENGARYIYVVIHRQYGKSKLARKVGQEYLFHEDSPHRQVGIWCSLLNQALRIYMDEFKREYSYFGPVYTDKLNRLYFKKNLPFALAGEENESEEWFPFIDFYDTSFTPDIEPGQKSQSKRGGTYSIIFLDEYGTYKEGYAESVAYPMVNVWKGPILHMGTPLGPGVFKKEVDFAYEQMEKGNKLYFVHRQTIEDSLACGEVSKEFYDEIKLRCSATKTGWSTWEAEYMLNWYAYIPDRIFGIQVGESYSEKRVGFYPADLTYTVDTVWDIGKNGTACWVLQNIGGRIRYVEFFDDVENVHLQSFIEKYVKPLENKYQFRFHFWPVDIGVVEHTRKESRLEIVRRMLKGTHLPGRQVRKPDELIDKARRNFKHCVFDKEKVKEGLNRLSMYKMKNGKPDKNNDSHGADAFVYSLNLLELFSVNRVDAEPISLLDSLGQKIVRKEQPISELKGSWWSG